MAHGIPGEPATGGVRRSESAVRQRVKNIRRIGDRITWHNRSVKPSLAKAVLGDIQFWIPVAVLLFGIGLLLVVK